MIDNKLLKEVITIINAGLVANNFVGISIPNTAKTKQAYQPTQEGINTAPTVYISKLGDYRYGWNKRDNKWEALTSTIVHTESQKIETMYQVSALVRQLPTSINPDASDKITASDLVNCVAGILNSDYGVTTLQSKGIGIYRINNIRNPYFIDDKGQFEASPSFDFTLTHNQDIVMTSPVVTTIEYNIARV